MTEVFLAFCPQDHGPNRACACGPEGVLMRAECAKNNVVQTHLQPMLSGLTSLGSRTGTRCTCECSHTQLFVCTQRRHSQQLQVGTNKS